MSVSRIHPLLSQHSSSGASSVTGTLPQSTSTFRRFTYQGETDGVHTYSLVDERILGEPDILNIADELEKIKDQNHGKVIIDFRNVEFLSSAAIGKLKTFHKITEQSHQQYRLWGMRPNVYQSFVSTKENKNVNISTTPHFEAVVAELNK